MSDKPTIANTESTTMTVIIPLVPDFNYFLTSVGDAPYCRRFRRLRARGFLTSDAFVYFLFL